MCGYIFQDCSVKTNTSVCSYLLYIILFIVALSEMYCLTLLWDELYLTYLTPLTSPLLSKVSLSCSVNHFENLSIIWWLTFFLITSWYSNLSLMSILYSKELGTGNSFPIVKICVGSYSLFLANYGSNLLFFDHEVFCSNVLLKGCLLIDPHDIFKHFSKVSQSNLHLTYPS